MKIQYRNYDGKTGKINQEGSMDVEIVLEGPAKQLADNCLTISSALIDLGSQASSLVAMFGGEESGFLADIIESCLPGGALGNVFSVGRPEDGEDPSGEDPDSPDGGEGPVSS